MERTLVALFTILLVACGARSSTSATTTAPTTDAAPTSLDEALSRAALTRIDVPSTRREMTSDLGAGIRAEGDRVVVVETAGWNGAPTIFARRADGAVVIVSPHPSVIVDRHVPGGCLGFAGGRGWFEEVEYTLPRGSTYGGVVSVSYDEHTEVIDYSSTDADGSPCPPPAID